MKITTIIILAVLLCGMIHAQPPCPGQTGSSISGTLTYDNAPVNSPICGSKVYLKTNVGVMVDSSVTCQSGSYYFCNVPNGDYILSAQTSIVPGSINGTDALMVLKHFTQVITLTGLRFKAGDVNNTGIINTLDALLIVQHYVQMISTFPAGDWVFEEPQVNITGTSDHVVNFKGICVGDVNGSFIPPYCGFHVCGDTLQDCRDWQKYPTVLIGSQCWMKKNLNIGTMLYSDSNNQTNNNVIEKFCWANYVPNCNVFGGLYQWDEMMQYDTVPAIRGICPSGFHIPTYNEWRILETYLGGKWFACGEMKETGFTHWYPPNTGANNESGFTALAAGARDYFLPYPFSGLMYDAMFWSSSQYLQYGNNAWSVYLSGYFDFFDIEATIKNYAFSVRCLKD